MRSCGKFGTEPTGIEEDWNMSAGKPLGPYPENTPEVGTYWRHRKTGNVYVVIGRARIEATASPGVTYLEATSDPKSELWVRPVSEFTDGRYEPVENILKGLDKPPPSLEGSWGSLQNEPCRYCHAVGKVFFETGENPADRNAPTRVRCDGCGRSWDADSTGA